MSIILTSIIRLLLNKRLEKTKEAIKNGQSETNPKEQARINNPGHWQHCARKTENEDKQNNETQHSTAN